MRTDRLTTIGKIFYYSGALHVVKIKHKELAVDINRTLIRALHPFGLIMFVVTVLLVVFTLGVFRKDFFTDIKSGFTLF